MKVSISSTQDNFQQHFCRFFMEGSNNIIMIIIGKNGQKMEKMGCLMTTNEKLSLKLQIQVKPNRNKFRVLSKESQKIVKTSSMGKQRLLAPKIVKKQRLCLRTNENINYSKLRLIEQKKTSGSITTIKNQDFYSEQFFVKDLKQFSIQIAKQAREYLRSENLSNKQYSLQELIHQKMKSRFPKTISSFDRLRTFSKFDDIKFSFQQLNEHQNSLKELKNCRIQKQFNLTFKLANSGEVNHKQLSPKFLEHEQKYLLQTSLGIQADFQSEIFESISRANNQIKQLQNKRRNLMQKLQDKQEEFLLIQKKMRETKEASHLYLDQIASHHQYITNIQQQKSKISTFLQTQPNKILKMEVQGYKECEQQLFNLAHALENSNYDGMLNSIYQQIDVPQNSFYYMIDHYQLNNNNSKSIDVFREKLKLVYHRIKTVVQSILKLKGKKIESFVSTLRKLASYTIGKRQHLDGITKKVIYLSGNINMALKKLEAKMRKSQSDEPFEQLSKISGSLHSFMEAFRQAQVFY